MLSYTALQVNTDTLHRLLDFLRDTGSKLDAAAAADEAILDWLDRMRQDDSNADRTPKRYQWKSLFLPEGTRLAVFCQGDYAHAKVVGGRLLYQGEPTTPNRFVKRHPATSATPGPI